MLNLSNFLCHQNPERTFIIRGYYFPVCARCTGIYLGLYSTVTIYFLLNFDITLPIIVIAAIFLVPTSIDGLTQYYWSRESNNYLRLLTGIIAGIGLGILIGLFNTIF